ncbi:MAG: PEP-CTERM sorting domain-containing protein [Methylophilus sp.]|nr:PEP-CTERM sorting domain-containing protein [Methylophilus sp.]
MKKSFATLVGTLAVLSAVQTAQATVYTYNVTETFFEPDTQPRDSIFIGTFSFDDVTKTVSDLKGILSESMTGDQIAYPNDNMTWLSLDYQLSSIYDSTLGGLLVTTFKNPTTNTFTTAYGGDGWTPGTGFGLYSGFPGVNAGNAYARIFVNTTDPLAAITQAQIDKLAYADCAPGGMMMATCMTGTTVAGYGSIGTMSGYPVSQVITLAAVPEADTYAMLIAGLGVMGFVSRKRKTN